MNVVLKFLEHSQDSRMGPAGPVTFPVSLLEDKKDKDTVASESCKTFEWGSPSDRPKCDSLILEISLT